MERCELVLEVNGPTENIPTNKGVKQSWPVSFTIFRIYTGDIFRIWKTKFGSDISLQANLRVNS